MKKKLTYSSGALYVRWFAIRVFMWENILVVYNWSHCRSRTLKHMMFLSVGKNHFSCWCATSLRDLWQYIMTNTSSVHDDVIRWKHFTGYRPFVWRIHRSSVKSPPPHTHKGQRRGALIFSFDLRLNRRCSKQSRRWWFETLSCSSWRHCNVGRFDTAYINIHIYSGIGFDMSRECPRYTTCFCATPSHRRNHISCSGDS